MTIFRATALRGALALGLSLALWAFVSFSQNPEESVTFPEIELQAVGLEPGLVIVDANGLPDASLPTIELTLSTDQRQRAELRQADLRAVIDLQGLLPGEHIVPVNVQPTRANISFDVLDDGLQPSAVTVRLEQVSAKTVPIALEIEGNLPFSFERGEPQLTQNSAAVSEVQVVGPQSRVQRVETARAVANIEQLRATYRAPLALTAIDASGTPIEGLRLDPENITVQIPINPVVGLKLVPVEPEIVGLPAPGFEVTGVLVEPPLLSLAGSSGPLDAVESLRTTPIEIAGARQSLVRTVTILFPTGTAPRPGEPSAARVTVQIAPLALPFQAQLPAQIVLSGVSNGLLASVNPAVVSVTLAGPSDLLNTLGQSPLQATVDVSGLGPGSYQRPVSVNLPEGVTIVGDAPVVAVALRTPPLPSTAAPTTVATPSPTPSAPAAGTTPAAPSPTLPAPSAEPASPAPEPASPGPEPTAATSTPP